MIVLLDNAAVRHATARDKVTSREQITPYPPPPHLAHAVVCAIVRRVGGAPVQAIVHANPYACLNVVTRGRLTCRGEPAPRAFVTGPFASPWDTEASARLESVSVALQPWVLPALLGPRAQECVDKAIPIADDSSLSDAVQACADVVASGDPAPLWRALAFLARHRAPALATATLLRAGVGSAAAACGVSERHYRRLFVGAMGLAPAVWARLVRYEQLLLALAASGGAGVPLAELAAAAGYADQSHMTRELRGIAARTPAHLQAVLAAGGGDWAARAAHVRIVQDESAAAPYRAAHDSR